MLQRSRDIVPLDEVAENGGRILRAVRPGDDAAAPHGVEMIAENQVDRYAIAERVVDRHRGVLCTDGAVHRDQAWPPFDLRVAVRHRRGDFLVGAGDELRSGLAAVVDERLTEAAEGVV